MGAFILGGLCFLVTCLITVITFGGTMMSDNPSDNASASFIWVFCIGSAISALIVSSHWWHMSW